jgi:hypothetical protein
VVEVTSSGAFIQAHRPCLRKLFEGRCPSWVQRDEIETGSDDKEISSSRTASSSSRHPRPALRRGAWAIAAVLIDAVSEPELLARCGIERGDDTLAAGGFVQDPVRHDRRRFALELRKHRIAVALRGSAER